MSRVIKLGQNALNILFNEFSESRMKRILTQNKINTNNAGDESSDFITSFKDSKTTRSLFSYLSTLPLKIKKQTLSKFFIFTLVDSALRVKMPSKRFSLERSSPSKSWFSVQQSIIYFQLLMVFLVHLKKSYAKWIFYISHINFNDIFPHVLDDLDS